MVLRTIWDIDLNDERGDVMDYEPSNLKRMRRSQLRLLIGKLGDQQDFSKMIQIVTDFMMPDKPFSGFINAYFRRTFPQFDQIFPV